MLAAGCLIAVCGFLFVDSYQEEMVMNDSIRREAPGKVIQLKHGKVHYLIEGNDSADLVVLIHGGGITGIEVWNKNISFLRERGYRVLAYDLYGRGYSDRPKEENTPELFTGQLTDLLTTLKIDEPLHLVALSMGAIVALEYTQDSPERVKKLVLIDPAATGDYRPNPMLKVPIASDFLMTVLWYPRAVENQRKEFVDQQLFNEYSIRLEYFMNFDGYKFTNYSTWMNMLSQNRLDSLKSTLNIPVLLIYGAQDPYFNSNHAKRYRSKIPSIQIIEVKDSGHMPHYEKPNEVNSLLYSFLTDTAVK
jgi:pimeloyl-ACP methyl ester carboxylesterase